MPFTASSMEELNLLMQFDEAGSSRGIKVHSDARGEVVAACLALHDKGLISQADGGYLTDAGIEALSHLQAIAGLLYLRSPRTTL